MFKTLMPAMVAAFLAAPSLAVAGEPDTTATTTADREAAKNTAIAAGAGALALVGTGAGMVVCGPTCAAVGAAVGGGAGAILVIEGNRRYDRAIEEDPILDSGGSFGGGCGGCLTREVLANCGI